jgi:hypothetical protein|tara:strand:+ start:1165 stop:2055 length:891 start_codon:yes stop_codon:yes gene_type:complete
LRICYFNTHATLGEEHADICFNSLANQSVDYKFDVMYIYNTHPQELPNNKLLGLIDKYRLRHHFDKIEILPKSDGKTLGQDMLYLTSHCQEANPTKVLMLKSDYGVSANFMKGLGDIDTSISTDSRFIFTPPTANAKEYIQKDEILQYLQRGAFVPSDEITYYFGSDYADSLGDGDLRVLKDIWHQDPEDLAADMRRDFEDPTDPRVRFVAHTVRADFNCHYMDGTTFSEIDFQGSNPDRTWNLSFWGIQAAQRVQGVPFIDIGGPFVVHIFHSIVGPNREEPREDEYKVHPGQRY